MGIKKFFSKKAPSEEEVEASFEEKLTNKNIPTRHNRTGNVKNKHDLFKAYGNYAKDRTKDKVFAPQGYESYSNQYQGSQGDGDGKGTEEDLHSYSTSSVGGDSSNPYANTKNTSSSSNPYASQSSSISNSYGNPYGGASSNPFDQSHSASAYKERQSATPSNPYVQSTPSSSNPYDNNSYGQAPPSNPYSQTQSSASASISRQTLNSYSKKGVDGSPITSDPYASTANKTAVEDDDLNNVPDQESTYAQQQQQLQRSNTKQTAYTYNDYDLNADLIQEQQAVELTEEQRAQLEEDEEVEGIKTDIRFLKGESVASTRNTLRMAREAEESGKNTMGMLGHQSESLYQTEKLLSLTETQERISKEKIAEIAHYRRHILKPAMKNPFTKGRRLREREERIKNDYLADRLEAEEQRLSVTESEKRIKSALLNNEKPVQPTTSDRYRRDKILSQASRYQFEGDEEDEAMELEIGENLQEIDKIAGRLKKLAMDQGQEINAQNQRLTGIEDRTQKLDVRLRVDTDRLARTK